MEAKAKEKEALASKAHGKEALDYTIAAAELYMKAAQAASNQEEKRRLSRKCQSLISKAESLKSRPAGSGVVAVEKRLQIPQQGRSLPTSEQTILLRSSRLHGSVFPPWESDPDSREFSGDPFGDTSEFSLSARQKSVFSGWKRPLEILAQGASPIPSGQGHEFLMEVQHDYDLVQDITTDCSVVASLCACMRHLRPGAKSILPALMFPTDSETGQPKVSTSGKYVFRMFFNGCFRKVIIDDRLPSSSTDRTLYVVDRQNPGLIWPALMEKAYLKVRGGYDFPGSNSGTDLCAITGWIPQQLFLQSDDLDWDRTWTRVKKAYDYGDVVITLGTGRLSPGEEETLGLAGEHDYAVLDMSETSGNRRLLVKNPWCNGLTWKGVGSSEVVTSSSSPHATEDHPIKLKPGSFWMSFDDVTQNFESLYLNWNPNLFTHRQDHHFVWQIPDPVIAESFAHNPQYSMTATADGSTWILLSRHFQDDELGIMRRHGAADALDSLSISSPTSSSSTSPTLAEVSGKLGFMSIYIFAGDKRVQLGANPVYRGAFVDSPQTLAPFEARAGVSYTIVVAAQDLPLPKYSLTLSFFSRGPLTVAPAQPALRHYTGIKGSWTRRTAGGNSASPDYVQNPQYNLTLPRTGPLSLLLCTAREDLPIHVALVWAGGRRVPGGVGNRDIVVASGDYRRGCALAETASVDAGTYTVVCSTFDPGCLADFVLRVGSDTPCAVTLVPPDAAGQLRTRLPDLPSGAEGREKRKWRVGVSAPRLTRARIVVTAISSIMPTIGGSSGASRSGGGGTTTPRSRPIARVSVEYGTGPNRTFLACTDHDDHNPNQSNTRNNSHATAGGPEFREVGVNGLRTGEFDIDPRFSQTGLWLVVEQPGAYQQQALSMNGGDGLRVEVLSEGPVHVGVWETVD
ncbi:cysteine proteinase [Hypoxylon trugodes]|uniref:cysteine proteinase n=1 Tax=Hypoxylon trugodes TaxID=326681 RepID=UPI0021931E1B|nr:cysteine proteinase [Hypoxylon trugodes]KAI1384662.1 cysteine proteinase [Hypoxylon trugodes]